MNNPLQNNLMAYFLVTLLVLILVVFTILIALRYRRKREGHYIEKQRMQFEWQQHLLNTQIEIQEQTFKTISQEIHDNIGQVLSVAKLNLNTIDWTQVKEAEASVEEASELMTRGIQDLRDLSKTLHTGWITDVGWIKALDTELKRLKKSGLNITLEADEFDIPALAGTSQLMVFRMVQEVLQNIVKHARAKNIGISIQRQANNIITTIADDGQGFDVHSTNEGTGLRNLRERAKVLRADLKISSLLSKGTTVNISIPTNEVQWQK